jgi:hypothetical protein
MNWDAASCAIYSAAHRPFARHFSHPLPLATGLFLQALLTFESTILECKNGSAVIMMMIIMKQFNVKKTEML